MSDELKLLETIGEQALEIERLRGELAEARDSLDIQRKSSIAERKARIAVEDDRAYARMLVEMLREEVAKRCECEFVDGKCVQPCKYHADKLDVEQKYAEHCRQSEGIMALNWRKASNERNEKERQVEVLCEKLHARCGKPTSPKYETWREWSLAESRKGETNTTNSPPRVPTHSREST